MEEQKIYALKLWRKLPKYMTTEPFYFSALADEMVVLDEILVVPTEDPSVVKEYLTGISFPIFYCDLNSKKSPVRFVDPKKDLESVTYTVVFESEENGTVLPSRAIASPDKIESYCHTYADVNRFRRMLEYKKMANALAYARSYPEKFRENTLNHGSYVLTKPQKN